MADKNKQKKYGGRGGDGSRRGVVSLVVLLVSAVTLMLGLSASRQTTVETQIGHSEELSAQAFSAAEAGLEQVLSQIEAGNTGQSIYYWPGPDSSKTSSAGTRSEVTLSEVGRAGSFFHTDVTGVGEAAYFWMRNPTDFSETYDEDEVELCWETASDLGVVIYSYYDDGGVYGVERWAFDENGGRRGQNGFSTIPSPAQDCGSGYEGAKIDIGSGSKQPVLLVAVPYTNGSRFGVVSTSGIFPTQGYEFRSLGIAQQVEVALEMYYGWPVPPFYFLDGLFSGGNISN